MERRKNLNDKFGFVGKIMRKKTTLKDIACFSKGSQINGDLLLDEGKYEYLNGGTKASGTWNEFNVNGKTITISEGGNSCGYVNFMKEKFWCGAHCYYLFDVKCNPKYLYYLLKGNQTNLMKLRSGACMPNIKKSDLGNFKFVYDNDVIHQNKIISIFDDLTNVIDFYEKQIKYFDNLVKARFIEMFGDININNKNWHTEHLGKLCNIVRGSSPRPIEKYLGGDIPWIKIGDATDGDNIYLNSTKEHIIREGVNKSRFVKKGSLIFANCGVSLGFARIISFDGCIHDGWLALENIDSRLNKEFLLLSLNQLTDHFRIIAPSGTQPNLNIAIMQNFMQVIPPMELQETFVSFRRQVDKSREEVKKSLEKTQQLYDSLMQEYFG